MKHCLFFFPLRTLHKPDCIWRDLWECVRTWCVPVLAVLLQFVVLLINSCFSVPSALLGHHSFIQMLTLFTLQDFDTLLMHVLTAESFHVLNWVSIFTFPLIKLQFYFKVISLDISRSKAQYYFLQIWLTQLDTHTQKGRKETLHVSSIYVVHLLGIF